MKPPFSSFLTNSGLRLPALLAMALGFRLLSPVLILGANGDGLWLKGESLSSNAFRFSFNANAGQSYPIAASYDLIHWKLLTNLSGNGGQIGFTDVVSTGFQQRFYHIGMPAATVTPIPNMIRISPGTFTMGSPGDEVGRASSEAPQTQVTLTRPFWIGKYEVTQTEYVAVVGSNPSNFRYDPNLPVDMVTWNMASNYCFQLTQQERAAERLPVGFIYRLPTEAEWEYACRAGTTTPFGIGTGTNLSSAIANFDGSFPYGGAALGPYYGYTRIVGSYGQNAWGLCDMHGNLWEWCQDWYGPYAGGSVVDPTGPATGSTHVLRGGGYTSPGQGCRSATRDNRSPTYRNTINGFRVVLASAP